MLTLGRLPKALELARALHGAGWRVVIAEPFSGHVCKPSRAVAKSIRITAPNTDSNRYLSELRQIIEAENISLVIPVSEEALHVMQLEASLPSHVRLFSAPLASIRELHDKFRFARLAKGFGLPVPQTFETGDRELAQFCAQSDFVVKPRNSCSGIGVSFHERGSMPSNAALPQGAIFQEKLEGRHVSTFTLAHEGHELVTIAYEGTVFAGTVAVCFRRVDGLAPVHEWVESFVSKSNHNGFISFDFIVSQDGVARAIECNPRITSGIHFVDNATLAQAIAAPHSAPPVLLKDGKKFQQAYSTLTEAYANFLRPREFLARMRELLTARDVVWSWRDPLPFLLMTPMSWEILSPAIFGGKTLGEAAMHDIAWFDTPQATIMVPNAHLP